jgi:hypothetical protein
MGGIYELRLWGGLIAVIYSYTTSLINTGSGIQKLLAGDTHTEKYTEQGNPISQIFSK